jgi:hypothetical protein
MSKKIALLQVWFGPFPAYFDAHLQSCKNQNPNINFFIFTDQNININAPNIKVYNITKEAYKNLVYNKTNIVADISENRKLCDYKVLAAHLFEGYLSEYDYVGFYDIDCIFGDMYDMLLPHLDKDIISIGDDTYFTGIRGPFTIWKNIPFYNQYYKNIPNYKSLLEDKEHKAIDEHQINGCLIKDKIQITSFSELTNMRKNGRYIGEAVLKGKKLYIQDRESLLSHFYYKKDLGIQDNTLFYNKKVLLEDFYWVVYFDKKYEPVAKQMLNTISMFSNRKCIIYSLNYDLDVTRDLDLNKEQFISVPFYIYKDDNQDIDLLRNIKPFCLKDSCERYPNTNFVYIDTDCFLTVTADHIANYVSKLKNHPLINLNLYDTVFHTNFFGDGKPLHGLQVLSDALNIPISVYPRRKANVVVYNSNHHNFFSEATEMYEKYKNTRPGIFALHDEDAFNILLSKYNYTESLPTVDIEETNKLYLEKYNEYGASHCFSSQRILPKHTNDIYCFHRVKSVQEFNDIKENYLKTIFTHDELYITRNEKDDLVLSRKNFMPEKQFSELVNINIYDKKGNLLCNFDNAEIFKYFHFYVGKVVANIDYVYIRITEPNSGNILFSKFTQIHK